MITMVADITITIIIIVIVIVIGSTAAQQRSSRGQRTSHCQEQVAAWPSCVQSRSEVYAVISAVLDHSSNGSGSSTTREHTRLRNRSDL